MCYCFYSCLRTLHGGFSTIRHSISLWRRGWHQVCALHQKQLLSKEKRGTSEKWFMQTHTESAKAHTNRTVPVEQWPESLELLRHLASQNRSMSIRELAHDVSAPEISTRNRLARLEILGAVVGARAASILGPGKQVRCTHYEITQYGRDCALSRGQSTAGSIRLRVNSVFALAQAMNLST